MGYMGQDFRLNPCFVWQFYVFGEQVDNSQSFLHGSRNTKD